MHVYKPVLVMPQTLANEICGLTCSSKSQGGHPHMTCLLLQNVCWNLLACILQKQKQKTEAPARIGSSWLRRPPDATFSYFQEVLCGSSNHRFEPRSKSDLRVLHTLIRGPIAYMYMALDACQVSLTQGSNVRGRPVLVWPNGDWVRWWEKQRGLQSWRALMLLPSSGTSLTLLDVDISHIDLHTTHLSRKLIVCLFRVCFLSSFQKPGNAEFLIVFTNHAKEPHHFQAPCM